MAARRRNLLPTIRARVAIRPIAPPAVSLALRPLRSSATGPSLPPAQRFSSTQSAPAASAQPPITIPTVDLTPYVRDPSSPGAQRVVDAVRAACQHTGFFQLTGTGVPSAAERAAIFGAARAFFGLPAAEKAALDMRQYPGHRGYEAMGSQSYEDGQATLPDLKESFFTGPDLPLSDPRVVARRFNMGANVWPASLPAAAFRAPVEAYFGAAHALARTVLEIIARTLPHGPRVFDGFMAGVPAAPMRLLHYPPARRGGGGSRDEYRIGASAHTDFGAVTLLLQDETGGLEVQDQASERWVGVPPRADAVVVNVGDMLAMWTRGAYKSSVHRVVNRSADRDRYSVVFFYDGNVDCPLAPLDGSGQGQKWPTVEEHMLKRILASYVEPR